MRLWRWFYEQTVFLPPSKQQLKLAFTLFKQEACNWILCLKMHLQDLNIWATYTRAYFLYLSTVFCGCWMTNLAPQPQRKVAINQHQLSLWNNFHLPLGRRRWNSFHKHGLKGLIFLTTLLSLWNLLLSIIYNHRNLLSSLSQLP